MHGAKMRTCLTVLVVVVAALATSSAASVNILEKVARAFAYGSVVHLSPKPFQKLALRHALDTANGVAELELSSTLTRADVSAEAEAEETVKLPTDDRSSSPSPSAPTPEDSDALPSDALDSSTLAHVGQPAAPAGEEMRFRETAQVKQKAAAKSQAHAQDKAHAQAQAQAQAQTQALARAHAQAQAQIGAEDQAEVEDQTRGRARAGLIDLGGIGKRASQQFNKLTGQNIPHKAEIIEDCVGCRYIWSQVEMDVANARYVEDVQASFEHNCLDAQKAPIFYNACEDMYDDMYAMTDDYMSQALTVDDMCMKAKMCEDPSKKPFKLFG